MSLRFLTGHRRFASQGFLLVFCAAFAAFTLFVILRPAGEVEGQSITNSCPSTTVTTERLEVCLANVELLQDSGSVSVRARVEVNRVIQATETMDTLAVGAETDKVIMACENGLNCIEGGITVKDTFHDPERRPTNPDGGPVDELIAFRIRQDEAPVSYEKLTYRVCNDGIDDPNRKVKIEINSVFAPEYGYTVHNRHFSEIIVVGNKDAVSAKACLGVNLQNMQATGEPTIIGTPRVGETLTADTDQIMDNDGIPEDVMYSYQWQRESGGSYFDISGKTGNSYEITSADEGRRLRVEVKFKDDEMYDETLWSNPTIPIQGDRRQRQRRQRRQRRRWWQRRRWRGRRPHRHAHSHRNCHAHSHRNCHTHTHRNRHTYTYRNRHTYTYRNRHTYTYRNRHTYTYRNRHTYTYRNRHTYTYRNRHTYTYRNRHTYTYTYAHRDCRGRRGR